MIHADQRWIGNHGIGRFARNVLANSKYVPVSLTSNPAAALDSWKLARALRALTPADLFFSPGYNTPLFCRAPFIFTIHDLSHIYCPENSSPAIRLYYATIMKRACHRAVSVLTVSEFTRGQILKWSGISPDKVINVGCGVDSIYQPDGDVYPSQFPYLLCVSNRKRHKNEFRIVDAFARAGFGSDLHLIFTGNPTAELSEWIGKHGMGQSIHFAGVVPETKLPDLYRGSRALVFPSLYEGFGLPLLEAMACGTPVLTSNVTAMPEIAGEAALLVDPASVDEIAGEMRRIVNDPELRGRLREKGIARAAKYSWITTSKKVHAVLAETSDCCK